MEAKSPSLINDELYAVILKILLLDASDRDMVPVAADVLDLIPKELSDAFKFVFKLVAEVSLTFCLPDLHAKNGLKSLLRISGGLRQYT